MMETRVVDEARVSAAVKSAHMSALKARLSEKQMARIKKSMNRFEAERPIAVAMALDHEDVSSVVVSFAKTPLKAAQAPLAAARASHGLLKFMILFFEDGGEEGDGGS